MTKAKRKKITPNEDKQILGGLEMSFEDAMKFLANPKQAHKPQK